MGEIYHIFSEITMILTGSFCVGINVFTWLNKKMGSPSSVYILQSTVTEILQVLKL